MQEAEEVASIETDTPDQMSDRSSQSNFTVQDSQVYYESTKAFLITTSSACKASTIAACTNFSFAT
jgi:hypothetical protein